MAMKEVHNHLLQLLHEGKSEEEIRAAIEPRLAPGCQLRTWTESCITNTGTSGYRRCGEIYGCNDPNNNSPPSCGACLGQ